MRFWISPVILIATWLLSAPCAWAAARIGCAAEMAGTVQQGARPSLPHDSTVEAIARRAGLGEVGAVFRGNTDDSDDDDSDAIVQDEAPAARLDTNDGAAPVLEPIGTLVSSGTTLPSQRILTRRSPRGPPAS